MSASREALGTAAARASVRGDSVRCGGNSISGERSPFGDRVLHHPLHPRWLGVGVQPPPQVAYCPSPAFAELPIPPWRRTERIAIYRAEALRRAGWS